MQNLKPPSDQRVAVRVTRDALRQIRGGHPWVYDGSITNDAEGAAGDIAVVFDDKRRFAAIGLWDPASPIRIKLLARGKPTPIDESFWLDRIAVASEDRDRLRHDERMTGYRELNGESDGFPGLVLDRYGDVGVLKVYSAAWFAHLPAIVPLLADGLDLTTIVLRLSRAVQDQRPPLAEGTALVGQTPTAPVQFLENDLIFEADVVSGQKTGHFLDQRDNRIAVGRLAPGKRVLDVFSCTGGFATHAAANRAASVTAIDIAPRSLAMVDRHMELNRERTRHTKVETICADAFEAMGNLAAKGRQFDLIVVDPPSFAQRQDSIVGAQRSYSRLTRLALDLAAPGATLVQASCSSRIGVEDFVSIVTQAGEGRLQIDRVTEHAADHPATIPEAHYLKAVFSTVT